MSASRRKPGEAAELLARLDAARDARHRRVVLDDLRALVEKAERGDWRAIEAADQLVDDFGLRRTGRRR